MVCLVDSSKSKKSAVLQRLAELADAVASLQKEVKSMSDSEWE